jgi:hypothetical protein
MVQYLKDERTARRIADEMRSKMSVYVERVRVRQAGNHPWWYVEFEAHVMGLGEAMLSLGVKLGRMVQPQDFIDGLDP